MKYNPQSLHIKIAGRLSEPPLSLTHDSLSVSPLTPYLPIFIVTSSYKHQHHPPPPPPPLVLFYLSCIVLALPGWVCGG